MGSAGTMYSLPPTLVLRKFVKNMNLFLFATGLKNENENSLYDTMLYAKVNDDYDDRSSIPSFGILTEKMESSENLITIVENLYKPPRPISEQTLGVLGIDQRDFFQKIFPNAIDDVKGFFMKFLESEIEEKRWNDKEHVYYRARRIEMFQNLLKERIAMTTEFPIIGKSSIFNELLIPDKHTIFFLKENEDIIENDVQYDKDVCDKISNINVLIHATELKKSISTDSLSQIISFEFKSIVFAPVLTQERHFTREFDNESEFLNFFVSHHPELDNRHSSYIAVLGDNQFEFCKYIVEKVIRDKKKTFKIINVQDYIPKEIDYVCQNADHANYHAKRIESLKEYYNCIKMKFDGLVVRY